MLDVLILCAVDFNGKLVQRIIIAFACLYRPPGITPFQPPLHADSFGQFAEGFFLGSIFHLQQYFLLHQCLNGVEVIQFRIMNYELRSVAYGDYKFRITNYEL